LDGDCPQLASLIRGAQVPCNYITGPSNPGNIRCPPGASLGTPTATFYSAGCHTDDFALEGGEPRLARDFISTAGPFVGVLRSRSKTSFERAEYLVAFQTADDLQMLGVADGGIVGFHLARCFVEPPVTIQRLAAAWSQHAELVFVP
ncbi:MAG: hypothetical protein AB7G21_14580, partial [Dehalococcoidia bacterium]